MPITINGSGTLTGISVGGLPDGIVDTDMIAASAVTTAKSAGRKVLQVVQTVTTAHITKTSAQQISELDRTITPSSTSSKILLLCDLGCVSADSAADVGVVFTQGGSNINDSLGASASSVNASNVPGMNFGGTYAQCAFFYYLHSPSTTSQQTYGVKAYPNGSRTMYLNRRGQDSTYTSPSKLMCIELGGPW
tara:strand:+ start:34 stop:609 length:576 start_codon:yes stop_codon:yes gene_type:complete